MSSALFGEGGGGDDAGTTDEVMLTNGAAAEAEDIVAEYLEEHDPMEPAAEQMSTKRRGRPRKTVDAEEEVEGENLEALEGDEPEEGADAAVTRSSLRNSSSQLPKKRKEGDTNPAVGRPKSKDKTIVDDDEQPTSTAREAAKQENHVDENQCRVCTSTDALVSLFKTIQKQTIAEKLMTLCPTVSIALKDFMPQFICTPCLDKVNISLQLKSQCETTERELRKKLSRSKNKVRRPTGYVVIDAPLDSEPSDTEQNDDVEFKVSDDEVVSAADDSEDSDFGSTKKKRATRGSAGKRSKRKSTAVATPGPKSHKKKKATKRPPSPVLVKEEDSSDDAPALEELDEEPIRLKHVKKRKVKSSPTSDNEQEEDKQKEYKCDECDQVFSRKLSMILHKKAHTPREPIKCETCGQVFKIQGAYRKHILKHTEEPTIFECTKCEYTGASKAELRRHLVDEHGEQGILHECEKCKRKFVSEARLEKHKDGRCPGQEVARKVKQDEASFTVGKDLFKSVAPLTTTYWSDSFSD